jgi:hypothetical protein
MLCGHVGPAPPAAPGRRCFSSVGLGVTLALAGVGGLAGAGLSERLGRPGLTIPLAWLLQAAGRRPCGHTDGQPGRRRRWEPH